MPGRLDRDRQRIAAAERRRRTAKTPDDPHPRHRLVGRTRATAATPSRIERILKQVLKGADVVIINRGVSGELAANAALRIKNEVAISNPDLVIWQVGTNDALAFVPLEELAEAVQSTVALAQGAQCRRGAGRSAICRARVAGRELLPRARAPARDRRQGERDDHPPLRGDAVHRRRAGGAAAVYGPDEFERTEAGYNCLAQYLASAITLGAFGKGMSGRPLRSQDRAAAGANRRDAASRRGGAPCRVSDRMSVAPCCSLAAIAAAPAAPARAEAVADFYKGKDLRMIVSTTAGTGYDTYARAVARHLPRHIPGNPVDHRAEHAGRRRHHGGEPHLFGRARRTAPSSA